MKLATAIALMIYTINIVTSANPPTSVVIIESGACFLCRFFNTRDLAHLLNREGYDKVVQITVNPSANMIKSRNPDGTWSYNHKAGENFTKHAFSQNCANALYSNDRALRWAVYLSQNFSVSNFDLVKKFFTEDSGAKMHACITSQDGKNYTKAAYDIYWSYGNNGMFPWIFLDGTKTKYINDRNYFFLENICRQRTDRSELSACTGLRQNELTGLFEESFVEAPVEAEEKPVFDYEAFWNSPDDN
jgi:hypothetical protein